MTASAAAICSIAAWSSAEGTPVTEARATSTASGATSTAPGIAMTSSWRSREVPHQISLRQRSRIVSNIELA